LCRAYLQRFGRERVVLSVENFKGHRNEARFLALLVLILLGIATPARFTNPSLTPAQSSPSPDFSIVIEPTQLTVEAGFSASSTISISSQNGFSGSISLQASDSSILGVNILSFKLNPSTLSLRSGETKTSILTLSPTSSEIFNFSINVTGTSGSLSHSASLLAQVVSFGIGPWGGANLGVYPGLSITGGVQLYSYNGFQGNVTLSLTVSPTVTNGPIITLSSIQVFLPRNEQAGADLSISTSPDTPGGNYTIGITATQGQLSVSTTIIVEVSSNLIPDFVLWQYYNYMTVHAGTPGSLDLTFFSEFGFVANLVLSASIDPVVGDGPRISFASPNVTLVGSGSEASEMVVYTDQFTPEQTYSVTITAMGGGVSHYLRNSLQIIDPWYTLSAQPASLTVEQGSNSSALVTEGSPDRFFGNISMNATVSPNQTNGLSISFNPGSFYSEGFYVGSTTLIAHAGPSTPLGTYTVSVTGTSGPTLYMFTITVTVIPPSPRGYLFYAAGYEGLAYPGGTTTLLNNFTDAGNVPMRVTGLSFATNFGTFDESTNLPLQLRPGESSVLRFVISIPSGTTPGNHAIIVTVKWEYYNPQLSQWIGANPLTVTGNLPIDQTPSPPPPTESQQPTPPIFPIPSVDPGMLRDFLLLVAGVAPGTWSIIEMAGALYIGLVLIAVLVLVSRERVATNSLRGTQLNPTIVICPSCHFVISSQARFCSRCGRKLS